MKSKDKPIWEVPRRKDLGSTPLTPEQKAKARSTAKKAGRPYPNMVDNINAAKKGKRSGY